MEVSTMDGKKDFGVVTADMLQLDSIWKWTGDDGLIVASASESMLKYNALMHGADKPVIFTVKDCNRQPIAYVRELKHEEASQTWGRAYEYQILALNKSVTARTQAGLGMDLSLRIVSEQDNELLALIDRPSSRYEGEWRIKVIKPGSLGSDVRALILIACSRTSAAAISTSFRFSSSCSRSSAQSARSAALHATSASRTRRSYTARSDLPSELLSSVSVEGATRGLPCCSQRVVPWLLGASPAWKRCAKARPTVRRLRT